MAVITSAGTKLYVAGAHTTADSVAEYDALTWVEVGEVTNFGEFGASYAEITHVPVGTNITHKFKGTRNDGSLQLTLGRDPSDVGQADLVEALDSYDSYDFKIELNDLPSGTGAKPTRFFFAGKVMSYTTNIGNGGQVVGANTTISIDGAVLEGAKVAGS
ncbi:hypothetical protein [Arenibaculum pallidiluteum]|uniref:hypothetical protein n=1 Tax=Arenibaculum pallidiluteum TaxID=2812559 RepID=UPI001A97CFDD|nr:hypothetical protein [Arenibaculum pallidiluteum]